MTDPKLFYETGNAFGRFQQMLSDFPSASLFETIPDFHNTPLRYQALLQAVQADPKGRLKNVSDEMAFFLDHADDYGVAERMKASGELPLRVTHNDTKLNNIMIDDKTGEGICVIDLDTIMPGLSIFDFGDSIRFGANTAAEDEQDVSKVSLSLPLFESYTKGLSRRLRRLFDPRGSRNAADGCKINDPRMRHPFSRRLPDGRYLLQNRLPGAQPRTGADTDRACSGYGGEMGRDGEHRRTGFVFPLSTRINSQHQKTQLEVSFCLLLCLFVIFLLYNMFYIMLSER